MFVITERLYAHPVFQPKIVEKIKFFFFRFHIFTPLPSKAVPFMRQCGSYCRNRQATDDVARAYCMLDT